MIFEQARVVEVESDGLVVETVQQSACGNCAAQKGCGQGVLAKYLSSSSFFRIALDDKDRADFSAGDVVELGIDELALVRASLWLYIVPLIGLLIGGLFGSFYSESASILSAALGLLVGGYLSSRHARSVKSDPRYAPTLATGVENIRIIDSSRASPV